MSDLRPLRLGTVPYLAARPCLDGLDDDPRFHVARATPAELVERLRAGDVDAALVSSIEAFRRPGYRYAPSVAIVGDGEVRSVLLFARRPLDACATLALDPASRSGAALAQVCIAAAAGRAPRVVEVPAGEDPSRADADAYLRIGDAALRAASAGEPGARDLASLWKELTGLPFVFAVWLARPGAAIAGEHVEALVAARDRGLKDRPRLAREASASLGIGEAALRSYLLDACRYDLGAAGVMDGWLEFRRRAAALGLCDGSLAAAPLGA